MSWSHSDAVTSAALTEIRDKVDTIMDLIFRVNERIDAIEEALDMDIDGEEDDD